jgi:hypothetical protein
MPADRSLLALRCASLGTMRIVGGVEPCGERLFQPLYTLDLIAGRYPRQNRRARKKAERIPSGTELQRRFESVNLVNADLVSEAEKACKCEWAPFECRRLVTC